MSLAVVDIVKDRMDPRLSEVQALFERMYDEEALMGSEVQLAPTGADLWTRGAVAGSERFGRLSIAVMNGRVVGFAHGAIRLQPDYLGTGAVGTITHVFVAPEHRKQGIARQLVGSLDEWFAGKGVQRIELTVLDGNPSGQAFWEACGYHRTLVHMSKKP